MMRQIMYFKNKFTTKNDTFVMLLVISVRDYWAEFTKTDV